MDTGSVRKIDPLGRIVIPAEARRQFNIRHDDDLTIAIDGEVILIQKLDSTCTFCGSTQEVHSFRDKGVCTNCVQDLVS